MDDQYLEARIRNAEDTAGLALKEAATAMAAASLIHDNVIALSRRTDDGFTDMRASFARVDERFTGLERDLGELRGDVTDLRDRTTRIEGLLEQILTRLPGS